SRLLTLVNQRLQGLVHEDGGCDLIGLRARALSLLDQISRIDRRLAETSTMGPSGKLLDGMRVVEVLAEALSLVPGGNVEAVKLVGAGIDEQLRRMQRARAELDQQLR